MGVEQGYSGLYFRPCRRSPIEWGVDFFPILMAQGPGGQAIMLYRGDPFHPKKDVYVP